jgi:single-strand DNA-binding protein
MNKIILIGYLGGDAEEKTFANSQQKYWTFSLATTETWKDKDGNKQEQTTWHRCQIVGNYEKLVPYLAKGQQVAIMGTQRHESYEYKSNGVPVVFDNKPIKMTMSFVKVANIELVGGSKSAQPAQTTEPAQAQPAQAQPAQAASAPTQNDEPVQQPASGPDDLPF